jgi:hypothetical protein
MVNVVLNLLFLVAMFAISAAVLGSNKGIPPLVHNALGDDLLGPVGGWKADNALVNDPSSAPTTSTKFSSSDATTQRPESPRNEDLPSGSLMGTSSAQKPGRQGLDTHPMTGNFLATSPSVVIDAGPNSSPLRTQSTPFESRELTKVHASAEVLTSETQALSNSNQNLAPSGAQSKPDPRTPTQASPLPTVSLQVNDASKPMGRSRARITRSELSNGELLVISLPADSDPFDEMARPQINVTLRSVVAAINTHRVELWSYSTDRDVRAQRGAYIALASLRNLLVAQGWSPRQIDTRMELGPPPANGEHRIYIKVLHESTSNNSVPTEKS